MPALLREKYRLGWLLVPVLALLMCNRAPSAAQLAAGGWSKFRRDSRNTAQSSFTGPGSSNLDWSFTAGAIIGSSPAVKFDGTVYFVSRDQHLYALNADGIQLWRYNIASSSDSSPAIASDGTVYVGSSDFYLYALNPDGTLKWRKGVGKQINSSPAIGPDGTVYVGVANTYVYAINPDGTQKWRYMTGGIVNSSAAIGSNGIIYIGSKDGYLYALNPTGTLAWKYRTSSSIDSSPAVDANGVIYICSNDGLAYAVNPNGTLKWSYTVGGSMTSSPAVASDGAVVFGAGNGYVYCLNSDGTLRWRYLTGGTVASSAAIGSDGRVFIGSFDGYIYALNPDGSLLWRSYLNDKVYSSPAIGPDGALFVGSYDGKLYSFFRDLTPPTTPVVTVPGAYTSSADTLEASWDSTDPESGIAEYRYAIGTTPGATNIAGWTSTGNTPSVVRTGLSLSNGTAYYFSVMSRNGADLWSDVGVSSGVTVDTTPPSSPQVFDSGVYSADASSLSVNWTSAADAESGISQYQYAVGSAPGNTDVKEWTSAGGSTSAVINGLSLTSGVTYFISVRAVNGAGMTGLPGVSDGITVDTSAPPAPSVTDDGQYTTSSTTLNASWSAVADSQSGISEYQYAVGTAPGGSDIADWSSVGLSTSVARSGLSLSDGVTYYISVRAKNGAGLTGAAGVSNGILCDASAPATPSVTDGGAFTTSNSQLQASWASSDPQTGIAEYQYAVGTSPGGTNVVGWTSSGLSTSVTKTGLSLSDGTAYYFSVKARNNAGLWSVSGTSDGIIVDTSAPSAPAVNDEGQFTVSDTTLSANWTDAADPHSGIAEYQYAIGTAPGGTDIAGWTSTGSAASVTRSDLTLTEGTAYYFSVKARNGAGIWGPAGYSDGIVVAKNLPPAPEVTDDGAFTTSNSMLHAVWTAVSDPVSGIAEYQYSIGTAPGVANVVDWTSVGLSTQVTRAGLSLSDGVKYYFGVRAKNNAGLLGLIGHSDGITVDTTPPSSVTVSDQGVFTTSSASLTASWTAAADVHSGIIEYQYAIGTAPGLANVVNWTSTGTTTNVTRNGLSLTDGVVYYFTVRAKNGAGLFGAAGSSDGITVDTSPPIPPASVSDQGLYTASTTTLSATWSAASDPHSGISEYEYAIGTTSGGTNVAGWSSVGMQTSMSRSGLSLVEGVVYYISVRAKNGAGITGNFAVSDGIAADTTPPPSPIVTDDGVFTTNKTSLHATWTTVNDPVSGVSEYEYAIGSSPGGVDICNWTSAGLSTSVTKTGLSLTDGAQYYISIRAKNGAGLTGSPGVSDGIVVDSSPPQAPSVTDTGTYSTVNDSLSATWTAAVDPHSGIVEYEYAIGSSPGTTNVVDWTSVGMAHSVTRTGLNLTDGMAYYFAVRAKNGAGLWGILGISDGITVDTTPPSLPTVTDDGDYSSSLDTLHASWSSVDPHSGVPEYQYAIGTTPGGTDVVGWTSVGPLSSVSRSGLSLADGGNYYFSVKARNAAGMWSQTGYSDGIVVDSTGPTTPEVIDDGDTTSSPDTLHASWSSEDPQSGIVEYQYAIGTTPGATDLVGWTTAGTATEITRTGLSINDNTSYYFSVKARNAAGFWSDVGVSDGILAYIGIVWPMFHKDQNHRGYSGYSASKVGALLWEFPTDGYVESAPAVAGDGSLFFGCGDGNLYALTKNGKLKWKYQTDGPIDSSPAITRNGTIYFGSYDGYIYSLSPNGALNWRYRTNDMVWSSPVVGSDGSLYIGALDGNLYALNPNGTLKWKYYAGARIWSAPALSDDGTIYFGANDGEIYAIRASNGTLKWKYPTGSAVDSSMTIAADGTIYGGSGDGYFYALNPNGTLKWRYWMGWAVDSTAAIGPDGTIYVGTGHDWNYGFLYALNPDGTKKWQFDAQGVVRSSPAISLDGLIYFGSGDGHIYCLNPDGTMRWQYQTTWAVLCSPAIARDGSVYVGSFSQRMYCFKDSTIADSTAPTTPVVFDTGASTISQTTLQAFWNSEDPESEVAEYKYCIGTWPNVDDVLPWTSAGTAQTVTRTDLNLTPGVTYYFTVMARNQARLWSDASSSDGITVIPEDAETNIGKAKQLDEGTVVNLTGKLRTGMFDGVFYIQELDRSAGIKVITGSNPPYLEDAIVDVVGTIETDSGAKSLRMSTFNITGSSNPAKPLVQTGRNAANLSNGVNSTGLLISVWGTVTSVQDTYFYIDDGSGVAEAGQPRGIKVSKQSLYPEVTIQLPAPGAYVKVTGEACVEQTPNGPRRIIRPRHQLDILQM